MDAFKLASEFRHANFEAVETTAEINVCRPHNLPEEKDKIIDRHMHSGICLMLHNIGSKTILEVRGHDVNKQEFSYKFYYQRGQSVAMRAVDSGGTVKKLNVSIKESDSDGINIIQK